MRKDNEILDVFKDPNFKMTAPLENAVINGAEKIKYREQIYKGVVVYYLYITKDTIESGDEPDYKVSLGFHSRKLTVAYNKMKPVTQILDEKKLMYLDDTVSQIHQNNLNNYLNYFKLKLNRRDMVYIYVKYLEHIYHLTPGQSDRIFHTFLTSSTKVQCERLAKGK